MPDSSTALVAMPGPRFAPWWSRWSDWWREQELMLTSFCGPGDGFTYDDASHQASWSGHLPFGSKKRGSRAKVRIVWPAATPFVPPRIIPERYFSDRHQLNDGSMCLLAPNDTRAGWEGVLDILYWLHRATDWLQRYQDEGWGVPKAQWLFIRLLFPGPRYRQALGGMQLVALPPAWRELDRGSGRAVVRVPRSGRGLAAVVRWWDTEDRRHVWRGGAAQVAAPYQDIKAMWTSAADRWDENTDDDWEHLHSKVQECVHLICSTLRHEDCLVLQGYRLADHDPMSWMMTWWPVGPGPRPHNLLEAATTRLQTPIRVGRGMILDREQLDVRRRAGRTDTVHDRISNTQVLLVGLGSLGSEIAHLLAQEGFCHFVLCDGDMLLPGNEARHRVGLSAAGRPKTEAVRDHILGIQPNARIECIDGWFDERARSLPHDGDESVTTLVIGATGDEGIEHFIADWCHAERVPCLHAWMEMDGKVLRLVRSVPERDPTLTQVTGHEDTPRLPRTSNLDADVGQCADVVLPGAAMDLHAAANFTVRHVLELIAGATLGQDPDQASDNHWLFAPSGVAHTEVPDELRRAYGVLARRVAPLM